MRAAILGFAAGVAWLQQAPVLPAPLLLVLAVPVCAIAVALRVAALSLHGTTPRAVARTICAGVAGLALGYTWAAIVAHAALAPHLGATDEGRDLVVVGVVDSLPGRFEQGVRFNFRIEQCLTAASSVPPRVALSWYRGASGSGAALPDVQPGQRWRLTVRLQRPHGNANPYGFDYEAWLLEQGVRATGYVRVQDGMRLLAPFVPSVGALVERSRALLRERIGNALVGKQYAGVIVALVIGDQRGIDQDDWTIFNRTGISHLVSISGLHITMLAGLAAWIVSSLWRRSFWTEAELPLRLPAQKAAALAGAITALLYVLLAGFGVPAQRTFYMLAVIAAVLWCGRIVAASHVLCLALGVVILLDPWALLWPGFWLSFGAVATILYACSGRVGMQARGWRANLVLGARTQWAVTVGLAPLTLLLFGQVSLVSPIANALAIPVIILFVTPLALLGSMLPAPLSNFVLGTAHLAVELLARLLAWLAAPAPAVWSAPAPSGWMLLMALIGTAWMLAPRGWPLRWTGLAAWTPLLSQLPSAPQAGQFSVTAFDVGQGMALLVETRHHRLLYDTGPQYSPGASGATRVILPYLRGRSIKGLDALLVSHGDLDHIGGAADLLQTVKVKALISSLAPHHALLRAASIHQRCAAGQSWRWDGVDFDMLGPDPASYASPALRANARSCVLRIGAGGKAILLAGDIEAAQEAALLITGADRLRADVLLAPHHGSGTSSTAGFLQAVAPTLGIFQVGHRNRYRHPKQEVYARYAEMGIERMRTDQRGAITLHFGAGRELAVSAWRDRHARYWHQR